MRITFFFLTLALLGTGAPPDAAAEVRDIISEGTYTMGDGETPSVAESRALMQAKKSAVELAGTYIESYSRVKNIAIQEDAVHVVASGLMEVEVLDKKRTIIGDGINFWVKIKAKVDPDRIEEMADSVKQRSIIADYKKIQRAYAQSQNEIQNLKQQLAEVRGEKERSRLEARIITSEKWYQANEWLDKGKHHWLNREYEEAIVSAAVAILLNPGSADAYLTRGVAYFDLGRHERAIEDFTRASEIDPSQTLPYYNRGCSYHITGQYDKAIEDYTRAISLNPRHADAYVNRGRAYSRSGSLEKAVADFRKACELGAGDGCSNLKVAIQSKVL